MHYGSQEAKTDNRAALLQMQLALMPADLQSSCVEALRAAGFISRASSNDDDLSSQDSAKPRKRRRLDETSEDSIDEKPISSTQRRSNPFGLSHMYVCSITAVCLSSIFRFKTYFTHRYSHELAAEYAQLFETLHTQHYTVDVIEERGGYLPLLANMIAANDVDFDNVNTNHYLQMRDDENEIDMVRDPQALLKMVCLNADFLSQTT